MGKKTARVTLNEKQKIKLWVDYCQAGSSLAVGSAVLGAKGADLCTFFSIVQLFVYISVLTAP